MSQWWTTGGDESPNTTFGQDRIYDGGVIPNGEHDDVYAPPDEWVDWYALDDKRHILRPTSAAEDVAVGPEWEAIQRQRSRKGWM